MTDKCVISPLHPAVLRVSVAAMACPNAHRASPLHLAGVFFGLILVVATQLPHCSHAQSTNGSIPAGGTIQVPARCHRQDAAALLQLKMSFSFTASSCQSYPATTTLSSWKAGSDCCQWEGVDCDLVTGRVTGLFLIDLGMQISGGLHPALFSLTSLKICSWAAQIVANPAFQSLVLTG
jgi:hypothetical protein